MAIELATANQRDLESADYDNLLPKPSAKESSSSGYVQSLMLKIDEHVSVKLLTKVWGPRFEILVRLMLVSIFLEDSIGLATHFNDQVNQSGYIIVLSGLLLQLIGSIALLAKQSKYGCLFLVVWTILQPIFYGQLLNFELVCGSLSIVGGLLLMISHLNEHSSQRKEEEESAWDGYTQLFGRMLLPTTYFYSSWVLLSYVFTLDETNSIGSYIAALSKFVVEIALSLVLAVGTLLLAVGLKSRTAALFLAIMNLGFVCYEHPFWSFVRYEGGLWKVNETMMWIPSVVFKNTEADIDPWIIYELHKYYFFLGISTSGALLLLTQFGPGKIAIQKNEIILPVVQRGQD